VAEKIQKDYGVPALTVGEKNFKHVFEAKNPERVQGVIAVILLLCKLKGLAEVLQPNNRSIGDFWIELVAELRKKDGRILRGYSDVWAVAGPAVSTRHPS
jgi:hypothetical protein